MTIQVDDSGASEGISYSTRPGGSVLFNASDFNHRNQHGPAELAAAGAVAGIGNLHRTGKIAVGYEGDVVPSTGSPYYLTGSPGIDQLTFVPQSGYQGTATINYTGYGAGGDALLHLGGLVAVVFVIEGAPAGGGELKAHIIQRGPGDLPAPLSPAPTIRRQSPSNLPATA